MATTKKSASKSEAETTLESRQAPPAAAPPKRKAAPAKAAAVANEPAKAPAAEPAKASGFDAASANADWEGAADAVARAGDRALALVDTWIAGKNAAAVAAIAENDAVPSPVRKAARRGLNVLKSRGVAIPDRPRVVRIAAPEAEKIEAWFWAPDPAGTAMITIVAQSAGGRCRRVDVLVNDRSGIAQVLNGEPSRGQLREAFENGEKRMGYGPASVSLEWARAQIAEARARNAKTGTILPMGLDRFSDLVGKGAEGSVPHPIDAAELPKVSEGDLTAASGTLHGEPEFRAWVPSGDAVQEMMLKLGEAIAALPGEADEKNPEQINEAITSQVAEATDRYFTPELREIVASRMKDCAISVLSRAGKERAAEVMAVADAIRNAGLVTSPPRDILFLRAMFSKALAVLAARSGGQLQVPMRVPQG